MGKIRIKLPNESVVVNIAGDTPTVEEQLKINKFITERKRLGKQPSVKKESKDEQMFDTKSGVRLAGLRATLGLADDAKDEAKTLASYGLGEDDYTRDKRGRLAILPSGGKKLGLDLKMPTLVDESGFSKYDFLDLTGIAPELAGGVSGAVKGAALAAPFGPLAMVGAGAAGAAVGAGGGQAIEEVGETLAGIQGQTFGEVAKDVGSEALLAGGVELGVGIPLWGLSKVYKAFGAGKELSKAEIEAAGGALNRKVMIDGKETLVPVTPALGSVGAPSLLARAQAIGEKIFGTSTRLKNNNDNIQRILNDYKAKVGKDATPEEIGSILLKASDDMYKSIQGSQVKAQQVVLNQMDDLIRHMGAATSKNANLDGEALDYLTTAFTKATDNITESATQVDSILQNPVFQQGIFREGGLELNYLKSIKKGIDDTILDTDQKDLIALSKKIEEFTKFKRGGGDRASLSFSQMYQLREAIETLKGKNFNIPSARGVKTAITQKGLNQMNDVIKELDKFMTPRSLEDFLSSQSSFIKDSAGDTILSRADKLIKEHRNLYNSTMKIFSDVESASGIKNLRNAVQTGENIDVKDMMGSLVKNNEPETLRKAFDAIGTGDIAGVGKKEDFRKLMAGQWLRNAMTKSNIDSLTPNKFNGQMFLKEIDQLGNTAKELFGNETGKIRELAQKIAQTNFNDLSEETIQQIWKDSPDTMQALQNVLKASKEEANVKKFNFLRQVSEGKFNELQAADALAQNNIQASEVSRILRSLDDPAREKVKGFYLKSLIGDFGSTPLTDAKSLSAFAKRLIDSNNSGKLKEFFGEDLAKDMFAFGKEMDFVSRTVQGGDLVAANIAASPLQNLGKIARYAVLNRLLGDRNFYKEVLDKYGKEFNKNVDRRSAFARAFGAVLKTSIPTARQATGQAIQSGFQETAKQAKALMDNTGLSQQLSQLQQNVSIPNNSSGLAQINVGQPTSAASSAGGISPFATNPSVNPNPQTLALAQALQGKI